MTELIIVLGPTGSGKTTQAADLVARHPGWVHLSSGELLRRDPVMAKHLESGALASNEEVDRVVGEALEQHREAPMIVLDGFPRTVEQLPWLEAAMKRFELHLRAVVKLDITKAVAAERLAERHRGDDNTPSIEAKWDWYQHQTLPLVAHFEQQGLLLSCDGSASVAEVGKQIDEALHV
jgi:adenylate kinase